MPTLAQLCPQDVLQCIFEDQIMDLGMNHRIKGAKALSQVCQCWRIAAILTPRIWSYIVYAMAFVRPTILDPATIATRVGATPVEIEIHQLYSDTDITPCLLDRFSIFERLEFRFCDTLAFTDFAKSMDTAFGFPQLNVNRLDIVSAFRDNYYYNVDLFIKRFTGIKHLRVEARGMEGFKEALPQLQTLEINIQTGLFDIICHTPGLKSLTISSVVDINFKNMVIQSPARLQGLTALKIRGRIRNWQSIIECPNLRTLNLGNRASIGSLAHYSHLDTLIIHSIISLHKLAPLAPQIKELEYRLCKKTNPLGSLYDWQANLLSGPAFPCLQTLHLKLEDWAVPIVSSQTVEKLIMARLLPLEHERALPYGAERQVTTISLKVGEDVTQTWFESSFVRAYIACEEHRVSHSIVYTLRYRQDA